MKGEPPEVLVTNVTPAGGQRFEQRLQVDLRIRNPNDFDLAVTGIDFRLFKKFAQQGRSNARRRSPHASYPPRACQDRLFAHMRYVEPESDARTKLGDCFSRLLDAPGARALNQIRLLLLELFHHEGDGFFRTFHRGDQASAQFFEEFLFRRRGSDQNDRLTRL